MKNSAATWLYVLIACAAMVLILEASLPAATLAADDDVIERAAVGARALFPQRP